jgi:hypothetical protein
MDLDQDAQELKRRRREALIRQTRQSLETHRENKRRRAKERAKWKSKKPRVEKKTQLQKSDWDRYFYFNKELLIDEGHFAMWSKNAQSVYVTIATYINYKTGEGFPSIKTISRSAGYSENMVLKAIKELEGYWENEDWPEIFSVKRKYRKTSTGHWVNQYQMHLPRKNDRAGNFPIYRILLTSGVWANLLPTARALYIAARAGATTNNFVQNYSELEEEFLDDSEFQEVWIGRKYDICFRSQAALARSVGVSVDSVKSALDNLKKNGLIEWGEINGKSCLKVFLRPKYIEDTNIPAWLNHYYKEIENIGKS